MSPLATIMTLFIIAATSSAIMVQTQFRRFWHPIKSIKDFKEYLQHRHAFMAYTNVRQSGYQLAMPLGDGSQLMLSEALTMLLRNDSHTLIVCYRSYHLLKKGFREYGSHNKTPQIWSHFELAGGPGGYEVEAMDARQAVNQDYTDNRILAVAWTQPIQWSSNLRYNKSHITEMGERVARGWKPNRLLVLVFDAIMLSHTPELLHWMQEPMSKMPVLIRLYDFEKEKHVNVANLIRFVNSSQMWPYFFDLPAYMHMSLLNNSDQFTTLPPVVSKGVVVKFGAILVHFSSLLRLFQSDTGIK